MYLLPGVHTIRVSIYNEHKFVFPYQAKFKQKLKTKVSKYDFKKEDGGIFAHSVERRIHFCM